MTSFGFQVRKLSANIGIEAAGIDLNEELNPEVIRELRRHWLDAAVLLIRGQNVTPDSLLRFTAYFGKATAYTLPQNALAGYPAILVLSAVREMAADHLHDELRHHGFFAQFFRIVWPRIPSSCQIEIGRMLPQFILSFMTPDASGIRAFLCEHLSPAQIGAVLSESYPLSALRAGARSASRSTRLILKAAGVFESAEILDAFVEAELENAKVAAASSA